MAKRIIILHGTRNNNYMFLWDLNTKSRRVRTSWFSCLYVKEDKRGFSESKFSSEFRFQRVFSSHSPIDISNVLWLFNPEFILSSVEGAHIREILINIHVCRKLARFININFDCLCRWRGSNLAPNVLLYILHGFHHLIFPPTFVCKLTSADSDVHF